MRATRSATEHAHAHMQPPSRERAFRVAVIFALVSLLAIVLQVHSHAATTAHLLSNLSLSLSLPPPSSSGPRAPNDTQISAAVSDNINLVFFPPPVNVLFMTMPKAGTSTLWHWLYPGVTGAKAWDSSKCRSHVHDMGSSCWAGHASYLHRLALPEQKAILSSPAVLRVAIQRDPFDRLVSSYKSKFTCDADAYGTDVGDRANLVPTLRRRCGLGPEPCLNITGFAHTLDACRRGEGRLSSLPSLDVLDVHIRPQRFFFDVINYDMVIDVAHLSDDRVMKPIFDRLPYRERVSPVPPMRHQSVRGGTLDIPEEAAGMLFQFAALSKAGTHRYMRGAEATEGGTQ